MIAFPNCKINLGLSVTRRREDGYHDLETIFYPVGLTDVLEVMVSDHENGPGINFQTSGLEVGGDPKDNLCVKAYQLLQKDFQLPPVHLYLHKAIPMGAGLGGGSADGAFVLRLINDACGLGLNAARLAGYAAQLGSDCPFFIFNTPSYASGRGELLEPVGVNLSGYRLLLVHPGIHINTGWAFKSLQLSGLPQGAQPSRQLKSLVQQPVETWRNAMVNDFEGPVFAAYPEIGHIKEHLYRSGALYAAMSGSGSTVYGLFEPDRRMSTIHFSTAYHISNVVL